MVKLGDVQEYKFEKKPIGWYQVQIVKVERGVTSEKATPYLKIYYLILDGEHKGSYLFDTFWLTLKSLPFKIAMLYAVGMNKDYEIEDDGTYINLDNGDFFGKQLCVFVGGYRKNNGNEYENITMYESLEQQGKQKIEYEEDVDVPF